MSDYSELINYLQRRTASDQEVDAASAITTLQQQVEALRNALEGVIRVADRDTYEFNAARAALEASKQ